MDKVTICCGRSQTLRRHKLIPCDYYTCGISCTINPEFSHKPVETGYVHSIQLNAAGGFVGHTYRLASVEEQQAIQRAKLILTIGLEKLGRNSTD